MLSSGLVYIALSSFVPLLLVFRFSGVVGWSGVPSAWFVSGPAPHTDTCFISLLKRMSRHMGPGKYPYLSAGICLYLHFSSQYAIKEQIEFEAKISLHLSHLANQSSCPNLIIHVCISKFTSRHPYVRCPHVSIAHVVAIVA